MMHSVQFGALSIKALNAMLDQKQPVLLRDKESGDIFPLLTRLALHSFPPKYQFNLSPLNPNPKVYHSVSEPNMTLQEYKTLSETERDQVDFIVPALDVVV